MVSQEQLRACTLTVLMIVSTFGGVVGVSTVTFSDTAAAQSGNNPEFNVTDGYKNVSGSEEYIAVTVNSTSDTKLTDFNVFYNDTGPLNLSQDGIRNATYGNGTEVNSGSVTLNRTLGGGNVTFVLNNSQAPFTKNPTRINVTAYGNTDPAATSSENKSLLTLNYVAFNTTNATGTPSSNIFQVRDTTTNDSLGFGVSDSQGYFAQHCAGFINSSSQCVDADGNPAPLRTHAGENRSGSDLYEGPDITGEVEISAVDISNTNASGWISVSPESPAELATDKPRGLVTFRAAPLPGNSGSRDLRNIRVVDADSDTTVFNYSGNTPSQIRPNERYKIVATVNIDGSTQTVNRSYIAPTSGFSSVRLEAGDSTIPRTTVSGQVVNDSGSPVSDAVVYAQASGSGDPTATSAINSSTTGPNGKFSMQVPDTDQVVFQYQFRVVSSQTNNSTPAYYPTTLDNDGRGYEASGARTVLPAFSIQNGGQVDVSVTSENNPIVPPLAFGELSRTTTRTGKLTRSAASTSFNQFAIPGVISPPPSAEIAQVSPTTDTNSQVSYNVWGLGQSDSGIGVNEICTNTASVSQGTTTDSNCQLTDSGRLNLSVQTYDSIIQRNDSNSRPERLGEFRFWSENVLIVRNASTDDVVTVLGPNGGQNGILLFAENQPQPRNLSIPLPPGNYTLELRPDKDYVRRTSVSNQTNVTITAGQENTTQLTRAQALRIEPAPGKFTRRLSRSEANTLAVRVSDPAVGLLSDSEVSVTGQLKYRNGTTAGSSFDFSYDSTNQTFSTDVNPETDLGVSAGKYSLELTATNQTGTATYNSTRSGPVTVSNFQTGLDTGGFVFGPGDSVSTTVYAYNTTSQTGITATGNNVTLNVYDTNGLLVSSTSGDITDGRGTIDLTLPSEQGRYRIETIVTSDADGSQGVSERPVRVSALDVDTETDQNSYRAGDDVELTVSAENATSGNSVSGASIEATVVSSGQSVRKSTGTDGEATFTLDPSTFAASGSQWRGGTQFVRLTVVNETQSGVVRIDTGAPFRVQRIRAIVEPTRRTFDPTNNATVDVFVPPNSNVNSVKATVLDDDDASIAGTQQSSGYYQVDLGQLSVGRHRGTITVATGSGERDFPVEFRVSRFNIEAKTDQFTYSAGEQINTSVTLTYANNGSVVSDQQVNATLFESNPSNEINQSYETATTGSDGTVTIGSSSFNSTSSGRHYVEVEAAGETTSTRLLVNNIDVSLLDSPGGSEINEFTAAPGDTVQIYVNASNATTQTGIDGATVGAVVSTARGPESLTRNTTTNGETILEFTIPESVPERRYGLRVGARTSDGDLGIGYGTLQVSGSSISGSLDSRVYSPDEDATFTATATYANGTGIEGRNITFRIDPPDGSETTIGTAVTGPDGTATLSHTISTDSTEGVYDLRVSNGSVGSDSTGFRVSSLEATLTANQSTYAPGDTIGLTIEAVDDSDGAVNATSGLVRVASPLGPRETTFSTSGTAPYTVNITIPDESAAIGSYTFQAGVRENASISVDSTSVEVINGSATLNVSAPEEISVDNSTNVTLNASADTTASLSVFSPGSGKVVYENDSVSLASGTPKNVSLSVSSPGVYVIKAEAEGIGTKTIVRRVTSQNVSITTGTSLSENASEFDTTQDIYISTNEPNATATVIGANSTYTVPLNRESGDTNYGVLSTDRAEGVYLVRLDLSNSTAADSTIIEVSS